MPEDNRQPTGRIFPFAAGKGTLCGIFGGSFNPIHNGHVSLAKEMLSTLGLDEVWFLVSPHNPLKPRGALLDDDLRLEMVRMALSDEPQLAASDYEFRLPRPSYTYDTLRRLSADYPLHRFVLLIGADNWQLFGEWRNAGEILAHYPIAIYPREGYSVDVASLPPTVRLVDTPLHNISSTAVRRMIAEGRDIRGYVHPQVADFIAREHLYR
ncbi:nicotinate (nicotinamide) nucleotide adenylyltransferase [Prevotella sp.]|uniref:nicotinate (nicotinamide) nucleotide adenylyltransferase n=1 Tax=Prevotella sp. TaxID=59823 RepID=UPI0039C2D8C7